MSKDAKNVSRFYSEENSLSNAIQNFIFSDEEIWMATRNGVLVIDMQTGKKIRQYDTNDGGLPYNNIRDIFKDSKNGIWVATNSNSLIDIKNDRKLTPPDNMETEFSAIAEDEHGRIWAGTLGTGVYLFDDTRDTLAVYRFTAEDDELMTNYCYALASDGNGRIWVGHRRGLSSINTQRLTVNTYGADNSSIYGDVNPLAMVLNSSGEMLIGMTDGVMLYDSKIDRQDVVPMLNLSQVYFDDIPYNTHQPLTLPYKRSGYRVRFDFVGLQYSDPASVFYQYLLQEKYENNWTSFSKSNTVTYPRVLNGKFSFWVKACNSDHCTAETMLFSFEVRNPFWQSWWFSLAVIATIIGLGYVVIALRERSLRRQQEFLENELKARTKEVRKQKEEIEVKNKDITDSINYAQRIQFSVLPSTDTLREHCSGAFIFYLPRDIVSGDFYWFDYFPSTKRLLIVCADSTGHGVPGAFMSLIGTTLIKDIAMRADALDPADILYRLDENIQSTLNQNRDSEHATDGMDITVCEINTETYLTKISSAMRPFIIYKNGGQMICKSSRSSIGGQYLENKLFETKEVQLSKGDTIYMFTDGYTDQFGGPAGKKFKMNRLQNILNDIQQRNMDEQHRVIRENFNLWKGNDKQVDDVLMIGVKL
jgi:serine phosphatase RsbU (regulator of sigma subunit)